MRRKALIFVFPLIAFFGGVAHATHKNWLLRNSGAACSFSKPVVAEEWYDTSLNYYKYPPTSPDRYAVCPVSLAGRWGSSGAISFQPVRNAKAMWANVYAYHPGTAGRVISCKAVARLGSTGSLYYSRSATATGQGHKRLSFMTVAQDWGGDLETNESLTLMSLDFGCTIPPDARINGYKVKICQRGGACDDASGNDNDLDSTEGLFSPVQVSGIECTAQNHYGTFKRSENGIKNHGTVFTGEDKVLCPIAPPADDSYEHQRTVQRARVYFRGNNKGWTGCAASNSCPACYIVASDRAGNYYMSQLMDVPTAGAGYVEQKSGERFATKQEIGLAFKCEVPPGYTIVGGTAELSVTRISGGI